MRLAHLALVAGSCAVLALTTACAGEAKHPSETPLPKSTVYQVKTTSADVARGDTLSTSAMRASINDAAIRLAAQMCDREARCHAGGSRTVEECRRANLDRTRAEVREWSCSPTGTRERAAQCLVSIAAEPCEVNLDQRSALCSSDLRCEPAGPRLLP